MEPVFVVLYDDGRESQRLAELVTNLERANVVVIGSNDRIPEPKTLDALLEVINYQIPIEFPEFEFKKHYPDHGHYRVDFRTGKPLKY